MDQRCVNVQEAKTHLSALLARVAAGERIVLGFLEGHVDDAFFEPLARRRTGALGRMKLLLETHVLLWALLEPQKLSLALRNSLEDSDNTLVVSAASA